MEVITIESATFQKLMDEIKEIKSALEELGKKAKMEDQWLDNTEVCNLLKVSKRTLQNYRDNGKLSFCQVGAKILYRTTDIEDFLKRHYIKAFRVK